MNSTAPLSKTLLPPPLELAFNSYEGTSSYGEDGPSFEEQADDEAQVGGDLARPNARYTAGNVYDFINAQPTL